MDQQTKEAWLAAGLVCQVGAEPSILCQPLELTWLKETAAHLAGALPPLGLLLDAGRLLLRSPFEVTRFGSRKAPPLLRAAIASSTEQLLGRMRGRSSLEDARDAIAALPTSLRPTAVALFAQRSAEDAAISVSTTMVRRLLDRPLAEITWLGQEALHNETVVQLLAEQHLKIAERARRRAALLSEQDVFLFANLKALSTPAQRLRFEQALEAMLLFSRKLPKWARSTRTRHNRTMTALEEESSYPVGGYASIASVGPLQNLLSSELAYLEERSGAPDLFDVRYAADELLRYTRDEDAHVRGSRHIAFSLQPGLEEARVKDEEAEWQRLVMLLGGVLAAVKRLVGWLSTTDLRIDLLFPERALEPELHLCPLLLRDEVRARTVHVLRASEQEKRAVREANVETITVGLRTEGLCLFLDQDVLHLLDPPRNPVSGRGIDGWTDVLSRLLARIV